MAKDPAFLFYTNDFLSGISDLTMEERGQFITLLCLQHQKGRLTEKMISISCGNAAADVIQKFIKDDSGLYYNERLEVEINKRMQHAEKQRQRALTGWEKRRKKSKTNIDATANATALPLVNENENINKDITYSVLKLKEKYKKEKKVHEVICKREKITNIVLLEKIEEFTDELIAQGRKSDYWAEYTKYFNNWLKLQLNKKQSIQKIDLTLTIEERKKDFAANLSKITKPNKLSKAFYKKMIEVVGNKLAFECIAFFVIENEFYKFKENYNKSKGQKL